MYIQLCYIMNTSILTFGAHVHFLHDLVSPSHYTSRMYKKKLLCICLLRMSAVLELVNNANETEHTIMSWRLIATLLITGEYFLSKYMAESIAI